MTIPQGTRLGRYEIRSLLGAGGMGEVYLADDLNLHRRVAIKVLPAELTTDKDRLQRFEREAFTASSLNHPNILTIYEIGSEEDLFIATEFIDGESLGERLRRESFSVHEVLDVGIQIAAALAAAHAAGIVHRDIKPDNVMLRRDHVVKVLDFGLAKLSEPETASVDTEGETRAKPLTTSGVVMGTARYMSPEQARGLPVDARTDIWSLGVVLYELVTRHAPFTGKTMSDVIVAVLSKHPPLLTTYEADVPAELERIITKALRKDVEERYQSARDLRLDLKALQKRLEFEAELERSGEGRRSVESKQAVSSLDKSAAHPINNADPQQVLTSPQAKTAAAAATSKPNRITSIARRRWKTLSAAAVVVFGLVAVVAGGLYRRLQTPVTLTDKDVIVLAEFTNTTGDPVFDGTLRQGLLSQLEQSPFLSFLTDQQIGKTLALMERPKDARLTHQLARDICQRTGSKASIEGSISGIGAPFTLSVKAVDCQSGNVVADVQESAPRREQVLQAMGSAATKLRKVLGESLASVQKYDVPPENVTTGSLEALRAYSLGHRAATISGDYKAAMLFFDEATRRDPNFAMAYARLAALAADITGSGASLENASKAYDLRERVSERERFYIESAYQRYVTEDLEAAGKIYEIWMQRYPRDDVPANNLASVYGVLGEYEKVVHLKQESLKREPSNPATYMGLIGAYLSLNRFDEVRATIEEARARSIDYAGFHTSSYFLAFLERDTAAMEREMAYLMKLPPPHTNLLGFQSETLAYGGQVSRAREVTKRAVEEFKQAGRIDVASEGQALGALREALVGNLTLANREAEEAYNLTNDGPQAKYSQAVSAIVFGLAGDSAKARRMADDLERRFPASTIIKCHYLPTIRGAAAMKSGNPAKAIEAFGVEERCELGGGTTIRLYRVYFRGLAHLVARQGPEAGAQFQKILDHRGLVVNEPIGALAHLGLGRAHAVAGDLTRARIAYQDFFALWKDADPDVPILKDAKAEYEKLT